MITTFNGTDIYTIYHQALMMVGFDKIKDTFIAQLDNNTDFTNDQKIAIKLAAEKLRYYPDSSPVILDGALLGIINMGWDNIGVSGIDALTVQQRLDILDGVLSVCKSIILAESDRLSTIASLNSHLNYGYGYGSSGYDYGFDNLDFFQVF